MRKLQYFFENQPDHINAMNENYLSGYTKMKKKLIVCAINKQFTWILQNVYYV